MLTTAVRPSESGTGIFEVDRPKEAPAEAELTIKWQFSNTKGDIINNRTFATSEMINDNLIVLSGLDLAVPESKDTLRILAVAVLFETAEGIPTQKNSETSFLLTNLVNAFPVLSAESPTQPNYDDVPDYDAIPDYNHIPT